MKKNLVTALAAGTLLFCGIAFAADPAPMPDSKSIAFGKKVGFEDFQQITGAAYTFAYALDTQDWKLMRTVFADKISVDTSATGNGAKNGFMAAEDFIWNVKITETGFEGTELLLGNPQVMVDGDQAFLRVAFYGEHVAAIASGDNFYTIGGYQDFRLHRTAGKWVIDGFRLRPMWTKGNRDVMNVGVKRGAQRLIERGDPPPAGLLEQHKW